MKRAIPDAQQTTSPQFRRRVVLATVPYLVVVALFVMLSWISLDILSAVRAYVGGESLWSKAQKEAVQHLERYAHEGGESTFDKYLEAIRVPLGDRRARLALESDNPDFAVARAGFLDGRNHPDDVSGMMDLFVRFRNVHFMSSAIAIWTLADGQIDEIVAAGNKLHELIGNAHESAPLGRESSIDIAAALERLHLANSRATPLEESFSAVLGDASRQVHSMLLACTLGLAATLLMMAVALSLWMLKQHTQAERALRTSEERFDMAVRGSNDGIWNWNDGNDELYLSPHAVELLGDSETLPRQMKLLITLVHEDDRNALRSAVRALLLANAPIDIEFRFPDVDGYRWIQVRGRPLKVFDGRVLSAAGSITDVTERHHAEELRRQLAADEQHRSERAQIALLEQVQGRMGRELHDDLGQQLTGIAFLAKALEQRLTTSLPNEREQASRIVKLINAAIDRVRFMSRQLCPIAIDEVSLGTALQRLVDDVHGIFGTEIQLRMTEEQARIPRTHASQFFRIAQESISNALRHGHATQIAISLDTCGNTVRLAISDNGCGFSTRKTDVNAGLGLRSIAIRAESLQGHMRIRSGRRGTTLIVRSLERSLQPVRPSIVERIA